MKDNGKAAEIYRIYDRTFDEYFGGWSSTTAKHLESFAAFIGAEYGNKAKWTAKEYTTIKEVLKAASGNNTPTLKAA